MKMNIEKKEKTRKEKLSEALPLLWNSYEHMYNVRKINNDNKLNFLLIITSFLPMIFLGLASFLGNKFLLIPIPLQVISLLILLKRFFIKNMLIPWLEENKTLKNIDSDKFNEDLFAQLKAAESETLVEMKATNLSIRMALYFLLTSIYIGAVLIPIIYIKNLSISGDVIIFITLLFGVFIFYYNTSPNSVFEKKYEKKRREIDQWLKEDE